jgi:hypothetical protein
MAAFPNHEHRPLKKPRLGNVGPDIYLQDKKQKEVRRFYWIKLSLLEWSGNFGLTY